MTEKSYTRIILSFEGDPLVFLEILKVMKTNAEKAKVKFDCDLITTITED